MNFIKYSLFFSIGYFLIASVYDLFCNEFENSTEGLVKNIIVAILAGMVWALILIKMKKSKNK